MAVAEVLTRPLLGTTYWETTTSKNGRRILRDRCSRATPETAKESYQSGDQKPSTVGLRLDRLDRYLLQLWPARPGRGHPRKQPVRSLLARPRPNVAITTHSAGTSGGQTAGTGPGGQGRRRELYLVGRPAAQRTGPAEQRSAGAGPAGPRARRRDRRPGPGDPRVGIAQPPD